MDSARPNAIHCTPPTDGTSSPVRGTKSLMEAVDFHGLRSRSPRMHAVFGAVRSFAPAVEPVLLLGESGTGKEGLARALHAESGRTGPFVALNCAAFAPSLVDGELFGHAKGAFTGAAEDKAGAFESAHGGTLFLDELGELSLELQAKLLRVLENRAVRRLGEMRERPVDVRIVGATHRSLENMVACGHFRADLFHRLCVLDVEIPPLRERMEDVALLARTFLPAETSITESALCCLREHDWPGNVRELRNVLTRAVWMGRSAANASPPAELTEAHVRVRRRGAGGSPTPPGPPHAAKATAGHPALGPHECGLASQARPSTLGPGGSLRAQERLRILEALRASGGNCAAAARHLGLARSTLHDRLRRLGEPHKPLRAAAAGTRNP
jgi:transcriptional regulator with GAF, ATPase, and Fis domain